METQLSVPCVDIENGTGHENRAFDDTALMDPALPFSFDLRTVSGYDLFDIKAITILNEGPCTFRERVGEVRMPSGIYAPLYKEVNFTIARDAMRELRARVASVGYLKLKEIYKDETGMRDGIQVFASVRVGGERKNVHCDNVEPAAITALSEYLEKTIIRPHRSELQKSRRFVTVEQASWPVTSRDVSPE